MSSIPLMQVVLDSILFFGLGDDETIDPDEAVRQLEAIASQLRKMQLSDKHTFLRFVADVADAEEARNPDSEKAEFLRQLDENLGLA